MAGPPPPPPLAPAPTPRYEEWILDTIDSLRSRKARPDLERICRMVRRRHGPEPERTRQELERLIQRRAVLRVSYKGSISYRNAARVLPPRGRRGAAGGQQPPQASPAKEQRRSETPPPPREAPRERSSVGGGPQDEGSPEREAARSRGASAERRLPRSRSRAEEEAPEPRTRSASRRPPGRGSSGERLTRGRAREQRRRLQRSRGRPAPRERSADHAPAKPPRDKKTEQPEEEEASMLSEDSDVPNDEEEEAGNTVEDGKVTEAVTPEVVIKQEVKPAASCRMNGDLWRDSEKDGPGMGEVSRHADNSKYLTCQDPLPERGIGTCHPLKAINKEQFNSNSCPSFESILGGTFARAMEETASRDSIAHPPDPTTATDFPLEADKTERDAEEQRKESDKTEKAYPRVFVPLSPAKSVTQRVDGLSYWNSSVKKEKLLDPVEWTVTDVVDYFTEAGFGDQASAFKEQEIDGKSLLLMQRTDVLTGLSIRLGPALKIYEYHIKVLQQSHFEEDEGDCFLG
uniref:Atherin n=1 Tax=Geotrypetes seraphini TaxID=260995 RepID=A0A6P8PZU0_GEOSA|nr:atherin [Geotrypetes seraphini]